MIPIVKFTTHSLTIHLPQIRIRMKHQMKCALKCILLVIFKEYFVTLMFAQAQQFSWKPTWSKEEKLKQWIQTEGDSKWRSNVKGGLRGTQYAVITKILLRHLQSNN